MEDIFTENVFLMVRHKKTTIFLDAKQNTTVNEVKEMVEGITKIPPQDQLLYKDEKVMNSEKILGDYNINLSTAKYESPAQIGLAFRNNVTGQFEVLEITPVSDPPELPDALKTSKAQATPEQTPFE